jgi:hypothetical protein
MSASDGPFNDINRPKECSCEHDEKYYGLDVAHGEPRFASRRLLDCEGLRLGVMLFRGLGGVFRADLTSLSKRCCASRSVYWSGLAFCAAPMAKSQWPPYPIGPRDSIFAMGVASIKFNELESVLRFIFGTVFGLRADPRRS